MHRAKPVVPEDGNEPRGRASRTGRRPAAGPPGSSLGLGVATAVQGRDLEVTGAGPVLRRAGRTASTRRPRTGLPGVAAVRGTR